MFLVSVLTRVILRCEKNDTCVGEGKWTVERIWIDFCSSIDGSDWQLVGE